MSTPSASGSAPAPTTRTPSRVPPMARRPRDRRGTTARDLGRPCPAGRPRRAPVRTAAARRTRRSEGGGPSTITCSSPQASRRPVRSAHASRSCLYSPAVDPAAFADLIAGYCLEVRKGQQVLVRFLAAIAAPALLELQRAILERGALADPARRAARPGRGVLRPRPGLDARGVPRPGHARGQGVRGDRRHPGARRTRRPRWPASTRPRSRAWRAGRREVREQMLKKRWWLDALADRRAGPGRRAWRWPDFSAFVEARAVPRPPPTRSAAGASSAPSRSSSSSG